MKTNLLSLLLVAAMAVAVNGCAKPPQAANAQEAIEQSKAKPTPQEQVDYLAGQAKNFLNTQSYDQAITVANHILNNIDKNSQVAQDIITQAKADMQKVAQKAMDDMKNKLGNIK